MRTRFAALIAIGLWLVPAGASAASCSGPSDVQAGLRDSPSVFVGDVVATSERDRVAEMQVVAVWKGPDLPERVSVWGTADTSLTVAANDARFTIGTRYLVIPENTRQPFLATRCSATSPIRAAGTVIPASYQDAVGADAGRLPITQVNEEDPGAEAGGTLVLGFAVAGVATAAVGLLATRRSGPEREAMADKKIEDTPKPETAQTRTHRFSTIGLGTRMFTRSGMQRTTRNKKKR